ncbi:hypothetical protein BKA70DRAFT_1426565 [Coprinopsis sp. MPI-PUGE-AT-0042]|nr:hypothetical protein BKA70DRAFT_1426565 [Coprinopsis sp. MPI-PUGE-AT-0042]
MTGQRRRPAGNDVLHEQQPPSHVSGDENMNEATTSSGSTESTASSESAEITTSSSSSASIPMVARAACPSPNIPSQIGGTRASHPKETIDLQIGTHVPKLYWLVEKCPIHRKIGHLMMVCMRDRGYHPSDKYTSPIHSLLHVLIVLGGYTTELSSFLVIHPLPWEWMKKIWHALRFLSISSEDSMSIIPGVCNMGYEIAM